MQTEIDLLQLGKRISEKRIEKNLMQKDLANMLGTAVNHLSDIERGVKKPSLEMLMKISYLLETPVDYFLMDSPHSCCDYIIQTELASLLMQCTPQSLKVIYCLAERLIEYQKSILPRDDY